MKPAGRMPSALIALSAAIFLAAGPAIAGMGGGGGEMTGETKKMHRETVSMAGRTTVGATKKLSWTAGEGPIAVVAGAIRRLFSGFHRVRYYPGTVTDLAAQTGSKSSEAHLAWTAPGGDGSTGTLSGYLIAFSSFPILNELAFDDSYLYEQAVVPKSPSSAETLLMTGLPYGTTLYFAVKGVDPEGNRGYLSNVPQAYVMAPASLAGTLTYPGTQGGAIIVGLFDSTAIFTTANILFSTSVAQAGPYLVLGIDPGISFYTAAFVDSNQSGRPEQGEDFGFYGGATPVALSLLENQSMTGADFALQIASAANLGTISGTVSYAGAQSGTLRIELWSDPSFSGTPIAAKTLAGPGAYSFMVPGDIGYFIRAFIDGDSNTALNAGEAHGVYAPNRQGAETVYVPKQGAVSGVNLEVFDPGCSFLGCAGGGMAGASIATASAGSLANLNVKVIVGPAGLETGGLVSFAVPSGWGALQNQCSTCPAYVSLAVTSVNTFTMALDANPSTLPVEPILGMPFAAAKLSTGTLNPGDTVQFSLTNIPVPCATGVSAFTVTTAENALVAPSSLLSGSPVVSVVPGSAANLTYLPGTIVTTQYSASPSFQLIAKDACGAQAGVGSATNITLSGRIYSFLTGTYDVDGSVHISTNSIGGFAAPKTVAFAMGQSSATLYALSNSTGAKYIQADFDLTGSPKAAYLSLTVIPGNPFLAVNASSGAFTTTRSSVTITPNGDGIADAAFVNFNLAEPSLSWTVLIASAPLSSGAQTLWQAFGAGPAPPGRVAWDGRYNLGTLAGRTVQAGRYYVRLLSGKASDDSLQVEVLVNQLAGQVTDGSVFPPVPVPDAKLQAFGPTGGQTNTDSKGNYFLSGISTGTYKLAFTKAQYLPATVTAVVAGTSTVANAALQRAPVLKVIPTLQAGATQPAILWGELAVHTTDWAKSFAGSIRLSAGTTTFDDGGQWDASLQQFMIHNRIPFEVTPDTYTVDAKLPGFVTASTAVYVGPEGLELTLPALNRRAKLSGGVAFSTATNPNPNPLGLAVSVSALKDGTVGAFASVFLPPGATSGTYVLAGMDPGSYLIKAAAPGFEQVSTGPVVVAGLDIANLDLPPFIEGGILTGNVTVKGNTSGFATLAGSTNPISIDITVWSPAAAIQSRTRVSLASSTISSSVFYKVTGLRAGTTYQLFADIRYQADAGFESPGRFPKTAFVSTTTQTGTLDFSFEKASGTVAGLLLLPSPAESVGAPEPDFTAVSLQSRIVRSDDPLRIGRLYEVYTSTALPGFLCAGTTPSTGTVPGCAAGVSSAAFRLEGLRTETIEVTMNYRLTGRSKTLAASAVSGSTTSVTMDLRDPTYAISGKVVNQVSDPLFNTNAAIVLNVPYGALPGYPIGLSSTTARVEAVRRDFGELLTQFSTATFDAAKTRVGFLTSAGTYSVTGLQPGAYLVRTLPLRAAATGPVLVPSRETIVTISTYSKSGVDFVLSDGFGVSGRIALDQGLQDALSLALTVKNKRGEVVASTTTLLGNPGAGLAANEVLFSFDRIPSAGFYTLEASDLGSPARYAARPVTFPDPTSSPDGLQGNITGLEVSLKRAASVTGKLRDANSGSLIAEENAYLLAPNFRIYALANPWVEGGYVLAQSSVSGRPIEADGAFRLGPLLPGIPYDIHIEQEAWDLAFLKSGSQNYAPIVLAGNTFSPGQAKDLGVVSLNQGQSVQGKVSDSSGTPLANIAVKAVPAFVENPIEVNTRTGPDGTYILWVSTFISRYYDLTAAPREANLQETLGALLFTEKTFRLDLAKSAVADFVLEPLLAKLTGRVVTADGGALSYPFGGQKGFPAAAVHLQLKGTLPQANPLGDIAAATDPYGDFDVPGLSSGTYTLKAASLGYSLVTTSVTVTSGTVSAGTLTLPLGASTGGSIRKADPNTPSGFTCPNDQEVDGVVAADDGFEDYVVGTVDKDPATRAVCSYSISGFKAGRDYQIALLPVSGDDIVFPTEGAVRFALEESTAAKTMNLTYRASAADCFATFKNIGNNHIQLKFRCSKALRNETALDNDLNLLLQKTTFTSSGTPFAAPDGTGAFLGSDKTILNGRRNLTAVYRPASGEARFSVRFAAYTAALDPATGQNYLIDKVFDFFTALQASKSKKVNNMTGGTLDAESAADEAENSQVDIAPGTFVETTSTQPVPGTTVEVGIKKGKTKEQAQTQAVKRGLSLHRLEVERLGNPAAFPPVMASAMKALKEGRVQGFEPQAAKSGVVTPFSAFYDLFLPAGIKHELSKKSRLKLTYDLSLASTTAATNLNVWYYNPAANRYEMEDEEKELDTINNTVSVLTDHFSVFVILASTPIFTSTSPYTGGDITVFNFPNPFNLEPKTKTLNVNAGGGTYAAGTSQVTTRGTILRVGVPQGLAGQGRIRIYNMAGDLVREYDLGPLNGSAGSTGAGTWYYFEWDGRNNSDKEVASGVYIGEIKIGDKKQHWKMAVVKDKKYK